MALREFLSSIGEEVLDAEEESFFLFSLDIPSNNLGFCDSRASTVDLTIHGRDYTIHQSPTLLSSKREGGTTGAVLWKITPLFAEWISSTSNPFWRPPNHILPSSATVIELGCGISGLVALTLAPLVGKYVATDQEYVRKLFRQNIDENAASSSAPISNRKKKGSSGSKKPSRSSKNKASNADDNKNNNIKFIPLDWELDIPSNDVLHGEDDNRTTTRTATTTNGFDLLISCDCIYNEALIPSLVRTCADICALRASSSSLFTSRSNKDDQEVEESGRSGVDEHEHENDDYDYDYDNDNQKQETTPTIAIIAQQQRSPDVFESWLRESMRFFRVWRLDTRVLATENQTGLGEGSGYVVHALVLKGEVT
ncbi:hypothetical protein UA08_02602 [Talaromyces atroroseus]|uniref:Diaminohydroxyphosphoribosylamino-pyrimidine deaminase n=1 Tax=Talaromyces atroroseus TaxID=1441469 RepID=A0A225AX65_TALAT|nr:hypothetical protein UA08_02602 [Talaromyces atroroseus]OKL61918.1 hypothetical protein UA08_02602 [Talaromyces atroroseus]